MDCIMFFQCAMLSDASLGVECSGCDWQQRYWDWCNIDNDNNHCRKTNVMLSLNSNWGHRPSIVECVRQKMGEPCTILPCPVLFCPLLSCPVRLWHVISCPLISCHCVTACVCLRPLYCLNGVRCPSPNYSLVFTEIALTYLLTIHIWRV